MSAADIACLILASGKSERFGAADKLAADLCGQSVLSHVLETAGSVGFGEVFCVSQSDVSGSVSLVENDNPDAGQGYALRLGLRAVRALGWEHCVVLLGDMPLVEMSYVKKMIKNKHNNQSVISVSESIQMPPALFNLAAIDLILSQKPTSGARDLFAVLNLVTLELDADSAHDVDTPEDLSRVARIMKARNI